VRRRRVARSVVLVLLLLTIAGIVAFEAFKIEVVERWAREQVVKQLELRTGARVELGTLHVNILRLGAHADNLTLHGSEDASKPPLFHADRVDLGITVLSLFRRKFALSELVVDRPQLAVQFEKDGRSNLPAPKVVSSESWPQNIFDLQIRWLELRDGSALINDRRVPLTAKGPNFQFKLNYMAAKAGADSYIGNLQWKQVEISQPKDAPFRSDISAKFTLHRDAFELDELVWKLPHSELNLRAELPSFSQPNWNLRYRGQLALADLRTIFRQPLVPDAIADFSGQAGYKAGEWTATGHYAGHKINLPYDWFHASGIETWGDFEVANDQLVVPNLGVQALGGTVDGRLEMDLKTLSTHTETRLRGLSLAAAFAAVNNPDFPVNTLHWDSIMDVDSTNTWTGAFERFRSKGESHWTRPANMRGAIPAEATIFYDYSEEAGAATFSHSEIFTPTTRIEFDGFLGGLQRDFQLRRVEEARIDAVGRVSNRSACGGSRLRSRPRGR